MSESKTQANATADPSDGDTTLVRYRAAMRSAYVAGAFLLVVCVLLLADYGTRLTKDPLDSDSYRALRAQVVADPGNLAARETLRIEDQRLREDYFRQRHFSVIGTWLAVAGCVALLLSVKAAVTFHRRLPAPGSADMPRDIDTLEMTIVRWCVVGFGVAIVGTALLMNRTMRTKLALPTPAAGITHSGDQTPSASGAVGEGDSHPAPTSPWPSDEEIAANWPRFRGPEGRGIVAAMDLPTSWDAETGEGILWKTPVPIAGNSSPIVWENRLFLTGADEQHRVVMCFDTASGKPLWQTEIPGTPESTAEVPEVADDTGLAAPTAVTDGRRVYAIFANGDVGAVDFDGNVVWSKSLGLPKNSYGHASSLAMWHDRVIIQLDQGAAKDKLSKLIALDAATGDEAWSVARDVANSWPSPIVIEHEGVAQIITCADPFVIANKAEDGAELWRCNCLRQDVGPSPTVAGDMLIVANEYPQMTAIRLGGQGDITDSEEFVLWIGEDNLPDTTSPLTTEQFVYVLASYGLFTRFDAKSGVLQWEWESEDMYTSSPTMVGDLIYLFGLESCHVLKPGEEEATVVGQGSLGEECVTSPAFRDGRMFIRGREHLFCIGNAEVTAAASGDAAAAWPTAEELAANWPGFRGPGGLGVVEATDVPTAWDAATGEGIVWKTAVPTAGNSSPVIWENRLFITGADEQQRLVMCFDTAGGEMLWQAEIPGTPESTAEVPEVADDTGFAAPTAVTDGRRVYAMFANGDVGAVDFEGKVVWNKSLGIPKNSYGHASSLAMWQDRVIIQFDQGAAKDKLSKLIALDGATGNEVWSVARDVANSWPSPIVVEHEGVAQIITCADPFVIANKAEDGVELWRCSCLRQDVGPSATVFGDMLIVANEYPQMTAIRLGGQGDITDNEEFVLWSAEDSLPDTCSPLATESHVYILASYGYFTCYDAKTGEWRWEWESEDMYTSSPTLVGELVYLFGLESCHVLKPGAEAVEVVGQCNLGEECVTTPAFRDGRMFIRGEEHLFCIGKK